MLRSNGKKAIENIRTYIMNNFDCTGYDMEKPSGWKETAKAIIETFESEMQYTLERRYSKRQEVFFNWCQGLPSIIDTCYYYNRSAVDDLANILEETEEEKSRFNERQAENQLTWLIYRELEKACR